MSGETAPAPGVVADGMATRRLTSRAHSKRGQTP